MFGWLFGKKTHETDSSESVPKDLSKEKVISELKNIARPAVLMKTTKRPPQTAWNSSMGSVRLMGNQETWPSTKDGRPMLGLCQLILHEMPSVPDCLNDVAAIMVFYDEENFPYSYPNISDDCVIRTYGSLDVLSEIPQFDIPDIINTPHGIEFSLCQEDFPSREHCPEWLLKQVCWVERHLDEDVVQKEDIEPRQGHKMGGWPCLVQSELEWDQKSEVPEFAFQIDSDDTVGWCWVDMGCLYFACQRLPDGQHQWYVDMQCY